MSSLSQFTLEFRLEIGFDRDGEALEFVRERLSNDEEDLFETGGGGGLFNEEEKLF